MSVHLKVCIQNTIFKIALKHPFLARGTKKVADHCVKRFKCETLLIQRPTNSWANLFLLSDLTQSRPYLLPIPLLLNRDVHSTEPMLRQSNGDYYCQFEKRMSQLHPHLISRLTERRKWIHTSSLRRLKMTINACLEIKDARLMPAKNVTRRLACRRAGEIANKAVEFELWDARFTSKSWGYWI